MSHTIVSTNFGQVQGQKLENSDVLVWKGIPYAKPPVGPRRFRAPESPDRWEGIRDATQFGPIAPQPEVPIMTFLGNRLENMNEDCLYLNIWSKGKDGDRRPVLVWIHGGAFITGSGSSHSYDGTSFVEVGDVVVVTLNYRLGSLGFLHLGELGGERYATSGINGLLDQIAALQWVKDNIEAFGGDPDRITLFGESAGAMSIGTLLAMPNAKGLFHQAILESGAGANVISSEEATGITKQVLDSLNIDLDHLSEIDTLPVEQLIEAGAKVPQMKLVPVVDGSHLPKPPEVAIAEGSAKDIPILIGTNKDEMRLFTAFDPRFKELNSEEVLEGLFTNTFGDLWNYLSPYLLKERKISKELYVELLTYTVFNRPATKLADSQVACDAPVWKYRFDWETPVFDGALKSCHALEIPFVWHSLHHDGTSQLVGNDPKLGQLANQLHQAWIHFAHHGDPRHASIPDWKPYDLAHRHTLLFNIESKLAQDPDKELRTVMEKLDFNNA